MLLFDKKTKKQAIRVCLRIANEGTSIAISKLIAGKIQLHHCEYFSAFDLEQNPDSIQDFIEKNNLDGANTSLVLANEDYQLLLTEAPEVGADELCEALWWKVKDLVAFEIENAQIDYIELPADSAKHQGRKIYAVIADKSKVKAKIAKLEALGLNPTTVEVPETALLHLVANLCTDLVGTSIIYLDPEQSLLMLLSEENMYLSRTLQYNYLERMDAVALDVQRSMDYYESQIGKPPCTKIIVLPLQQDDSDVMQVLRNNIGVEILSFDMNTLVSSDEALSIDIQQHCLLAISGSLRVDKKAKK
ncbi:MAG: hypothetical protein HRU06_14220 [Oceanospirillaceae bacterium]|nr:hypothetical protein [Oceanospirillaceae bacterium]